MLTIWVGGTQVLTGTGLTVGQVSAFTSYMSLIIAPLALMAIVVPLVLRGDVSAERILEAYDAVPTVLDKDGAKPQDPENIKGHIAFDQVEGIRLHHRSERRR